MFLPQDLDVDVLVVIFVQSGNRVRISDPQVRGVGEAGEGYTGEGDRWRDGRGEEGVFMWKIVVLGLSIADF